MLDMNAMLKALAARRPVFHSEADFQHELAWEIRSQGHPIRLEAPLPGSGKRHRLDILVPLGGRAVAIELKYKTREFRGSVRGEDFDLLSHSAPDIGRYDFLKDIELLERSVLAGADITAYSVLLTNDPAYWTRPRKSRPLDADFRIHDGAVIGGVLRWASGASDGTKRGREDAIRVRGPYALQWARYSPPPELERENFGVFRYLLVSVTGGSA